jgi:hypothetical protein
MVIARGVPPRTVALDNPTNIERLNQIAGEGARQGGLEWYNTQPLLHAFQEELGAEAGSEAYRRYLNFVGATSPLSTVPVNIRNASYYYRLAQQGRSFPALSRVNGRLALAEPLPPPYGHFAQTRHLKNALDVLRYESILPLQNPKPASMAQNLAGNQRPVTLDSNVAQTIGLVNNRGFPKYAPSPGDYGYLEDVIQREAEKMGMSPAQYQASLWVGGAQNTELRSSTDPFVKAFEDRVEYTAGRRFPETETQVLRRMIRGERPLLGIGGIAALSPFEPTDDFEDD